MTATMRIKPTKWIYLVSFISHAFARLQNTSTEWKTREEEEEWEKCLRFVFIPIENMHNASVNAIIQISAINMKVTDAKKYLCRCVFVCKKHDWNHIQSMKSYKECLKLVVIMRRTKCKCWTSNTKNVCRFQTRFIYKHTNTFDQIILMLSDLMDISKSIHRCKSICYWIVCYSQFHTVIERPTLSISVILRYVQPAKYEVHR